MANTGRRLIGLGSVLLSLTHHAAFAEVITFEDIQPTSVLSPCFGDSAAAIGCPLTHLDSGAARFRSPDNGTSTHAHLVSSPWELPTTFPPQSYPSNGTQYVGLDTSELVLTMVDGSPFNLFAFDAAEGFLVDGLPVGFSAGLEVTGTTTSGGTVVTTLLFDGVNDGIDAAADFQTFSLPTSFSSLTSVVFRGVRASGSPIDPLFSLDNISISPATGTVPVPATIQLLVIGLLSAVFGSLQTTRPHKYPPRASFPCGHNEQAPSSS